MNITSKSSLDEWLVQPLRCDENYIGVSPSGTELQKYHHNPSWWANRMKHQEHFPSYPPDQAPGPWSWCVPPRNISTTFVKA